MYVDNRLDMGQEVVDLLKEGLPDSWYVREHIPYHTRHPPGSERQLTQRPTVEAQTINVATWNIQSSPAKESPGSLDGAKENLSVLAL